jgi:hypothetical protein
MIISRIQQWGVLALAMSLSGCAQTANLIPTFIRPSVRLHHLALRNAGLTGGTLDVVMAFYNPNRLGISGTRLEAGLDINQNHFGDIVLDDAFRLTERDTTLVSVPLSFQWVGAALSVRSILNSGSANYSITGNASVNTPLGQPLQVPFSGEGTVSVLRQ